VLRELFFHGRELGRQGRILGRRINQLCATVCREFMPKENYRPGVHNEAS